MDDQAEMMARMAAMRNRASMEDGPPNRGPKNAKPEERPELAKPQPQQQASGRGSQKSMAGNNNNLDHKVYWGSLWFWLEAKAGRAFMVCLILSTVWVAITKQPMQMKQAADFINPFWLGGNIIGVPAGNTVTTINNQVVTPLNTQIESGEITIVPAPGSSRGQDIPDIQQQRTR